MINRLHPEYYMISILSHQSAFSLLCFLCCSHTWEEGDGIQRDVDRLEGLVGVNLMKVSKGKCSPAPGSRQFQAQVHAGGEWIEMRNSVTQPYMLAAQEPTMGSR